MAGWGEVEEVDQVGQVQEDGNQAMCGVHGSKEQPDRPFPLHEKVLIRNREGTHADAGADIATVVGGWETKPSFKP